MLYSIDSSSEWSAYIIAFLNPTKYEIANNIHFSDGVNAILHRHGINYAPSETASDIAFIVFPMPFIKIVENKIQFDKTGKEHISLVLEWNKIRLALTKKSKVEIKSQIKNSGGDFIYDDTLLVENNNFERFIPLKIIPDSADQISWTEIIVLIEGIEIDRSSGYYIRNINIDVNVK